MHISFNGALEHLLHADPPESDKIKSAKYMKLQSSIRTTMLRGAAAANRAELANKTPSAAASRTPSGRSSGEGAP